MLDLTEEQITSRLSQPGPSDTFEDRRYSAFFTEPVRQAAVLIPFLRQSNNNNSWDILFTRRTNLVAEHKGQVSFPGGGSHLEDSSTFQTALREAFEEIGLAPEDVRPLGKLEAVHTISNYRVVPVVGVIPWPYQFKIEEKEVSRVFTIPIHWLANPDHFEVRTRLVEFPGYLQPQELEVIYYQAFDGEILWGVSAEITHQLLKRLGLLKRAGSV